ncbi:MAG: BrnA antitoxin family protein [Gallionella sp.]
MKKTVKFTLDAENISELTNAQKTEIVALSNMPDANIDFSDIARLSREDWKAAVSNPLYRPTKTSTTIRVDTDVLTWMKSKGKGYQTRINAILRDAMLREIKH